MQTLLLAIDDQALPWRRQTCLYLSQPTVRPEPVLRPSPLESAAPDNLAAHFYGTVLHDQGRFRMWYYACHRGRNPDWPPHHQQQVEKKPAWLLGLAPGHEIFQGPLCYAESEDGLTWTKPALGQVLFKGSRANNALALPHTLVSGALVLRDEADPDPDRRYKMVYQFFPDQSQPPIPAYGALPSIALAVSADGLDWTPAGIPFRDQFVEPSSFLRHQDRFIVHYQVLEGLGGYCAEGGSACGRTGAARVSPDFDHWPDLLAEAFALAEPEDPQARGAHRSYDQVHLGVGAASFGQVCVGLYGLWHSAAFGPEFSRVSCDLGLLVANDGIHFREPVKGHRFLRRDHSPVTPVPGRDFNTVLCQANGILNVGDQTRIYHGRWRNVGQHAADLAAHYSAEVALATLPRDRWGALGLNPGAGAGAVCSAPLTLPADPELRLNAEGVAGLEVDLLDPQLRPLPGFGAGRVAGPDGLECPVSWPGRSLAELGGRKVCLQVNLRAAPAGPSAPRLYAIYVREKGEALSGAAAR